METTVYDLIKTHGAGKGENIMWESIRTVSEAVESDMPAEARARLKAEIFEHLSGGHYDEGFAKEAVSKMYYTDEKGEKHYAPYWTESAVKEIHEPLKAKVPHYNFWDFFVTLHMIASDNHALLLKWFPDEATEAREKRYVELAVNWLNDEDNPFGDAKIWGYLNSGK